MREVKNLRQNFLILALAVCFAAFGFTGENANAQTKNAKKTPTPAKAKKSPTPSKKESASKTAKTDSKSKTADKSKSASKSSKDKTASVKEKNSNKKSSVSRSKTVTAEKSKSSKSNSREKIASAKKPVEKEKPSVKKSSKPSQTAVEKAAGTTQSSLSKRSKSEIAPQIIVNVTSARVRTEPALNASTVSFAKLGSLHAILEQTARWYKVRLADSGKTGWISMEVADDFNSSQRDAVYDGLIKKYYREDDKDFHTSSEVFEFLTRARDEAKDEKTKADLSFKRFIALRSALRDIPSGKSEESPYKDFLKTYDDEIVYSEPSGEWMVRANLLWELHTAYSKMPIGEEIAWQAAQNPIPGECEGYTNCYIYLVRVTDGEYLNFYPNGKHAEQALKHLTDFLEPIAADAQEKKIYSAPADTSDRADFNQLLTELRGIVTKLPFTEKSKAIQQINKIAEGYR